MPRTHEHWLAQKYAIYIFLFFFITKWRNQKKENHTSTNGPKYKTLPSKRLTGQSLPPESGLTAESFAHANGQTGESLAPENWLTAESFALQNNVIVSVLPLTPVR